MPLKEWRWNTVTGNTRIFVFQAVLLPSQEIVEHFILIFPGLMDGQTVEDISSHLEARFPFLIVKPDMLIHAYNGSSVVQRNKLAHPHHNPFQWLSSLSSPLVFQITAHLPRPEDVRRTKNKMDYLQLYIMSYLAAKWCSVKIKSISSSYIFSHSSI